MSQNYELARLGDLCDSISGLWAGKKPPFEKAIVIRNTNFTKDCKLDLSNVAILDVETKKLQTRTLVPGDLIVEKSGGGPKQAVGRVVYFNETTGNYSLSNFTSALRIKNPSLVLPKYLQHFLYFQYVSGVTELMQSNSTGIRNLNILQFLDIKVPLPNLSKQHLIVEKLDHAFAEIDLLEENLELSNEKITELSESLLSASFEQGVIKPEQKNTQSIPDFNTIKNSVAFRLSEVTEMITDGSHNPPKGIEHSDYLMLSSRNVFNDSINLDKVRYLTKQDFDQEDKRTSLKDSDVLLTIVGTIGRSAVFNTSLGQITLQRSVAVIRPVKSKLNSRFLMYSLQSMLATLLSESRGVAQQGFYLDQLRNLNLVVPSLEEQHKVVETLDSVFANIERIRTQLAIKKDLAIMLRQSLLSDSFSPNYGKEPA